MANQGCFIDGDWVSTAARLEVVSPWSGEVVGEVSLAGPGEWEAAITAAERAAVALRKMSSQERREMLYGPGGRGQGLPGRAGPDHRAPKAANPSPMPGGR